jgi:hypothetical protein
MRWWMWVGIFVACLFHQLAFATTISMRDYSDVRRFLKISPQYDNLSGLDRLRIVILDKSFQGYDPKARMLPVGTELVDNTQLDAFMEQMGAEYSRKHNLYWVEPRFFKNPGKEDLIKDPKSDRPYPGSAQESSPMGELGHGLMMAQIVYSIIGPSQPSMPKFYLVNTNGDVNWRRAMHYMVQVIKPDIILHSQNFECCSDFNGRGYMDDLVNMVTADAEQTKKFIWINSVGNYGGKVVNAKINFDPAKEVPYVIFGEGKDAKDYLEIQSEGDLNQFRAALTWNSGNERLNAGTDKDLDLELTDWRDIPVGQDVTSDGYRLGVVNGGSLRQLNYDVKYETEGLPPDGTFIAKENLRVTKLAATKENKFYRLRVKVKAGRFNPEVDQLRIYLIPGKSKIQKEQNSQPIDSIAFVNPPTRGSEVPNPAGNKNVIATGDNTSESSRGWVDGIYKPDVIFPLSFVTFTDNSGSDGSSNAAAYFTGVVALMKAVEPDLVKRHIVALANQPLESQLEEVMKTYEQIEKDRASRFAPEIVKAVNTAMNGEFRPYNFNQGKLVLEVPDFNRRLQNYFPNFRFDLVGGNLADYQFYVLAQSQNGVRVGQPQVQIQGKTRMRGVGSDGKRALYPWEAFGGDETEWIEIKLAGTGVPREQFDKRIVQGQTIQKKVFTMPTQAELRRFIN